MNIKSRILEKVYKKELLKNFFLLLVIAGVFIYILSLYKPSSAELKKDEFNSFTADTNTNEQKETKGSDTESNKQLVRIDISGAITNPGVYSLEKHMIINDVIQKAGGLTNDADSIAISNSINKSQQIFDGMKIVIPGKTASTTVIIPPPTVLNINTAVKKELIKVPGISSASADKIIFMRPYKKTYELVEKGILKKTVYDKVKDKLTI